MIREWTSNTLALGGKLKELRDTFPVSNKSKFAGRPGWHECIEREFQFSPQWATGLINAFEKFGASTEVEALPAKVMLLLSGPKVPQVAVDEVVLEAKTGNKVSEKEAKEIVKKHKPQKETGKKRQRSQPSRSATAASVPGSSTASVPVPFSPQPAREPEQAPPLPVLIRPRTTTPVSCPTSSENSSTATRTPVSATPARPSPRCGSASKRCMTTTPTVCGPRSSWRCKRTTASPKS
jgi:hypothetical protein